MFRGFWDTSCLTAVITLPPSPRVTQKWLMGGGGGINTIFDRKGIPFLLHSCFTLWYLFPVKKKIIIIITFKRNPTFCVDIVMFWYGKREPFIRAGSWGGPAKIGSELKLNLNLLISLKGYCKYFNLVELLSWAVKGKLTVVKVDRGLRHSFLIFKQHCTLHFNGHSFRFNEIN